MSDDRETHLARMRERIARQDAELAARDAAHLAEVRARASGSDDDEPPKAARRGKK